MPDITMCEGGDCHQKDKCYRFTAEPNPYRQSYFMGTPINPDGNCFHFSPNVLVEQTRSGHYIELERVD